MHLTKETVLPLTVCAAIGAGLIGGLLFAFSNFVMKALSQQTPENGVRTMQAINVYILNPLFILIFIGTALASAVLVVTAFTRLPSPDARLLLAGAVLYLVGVLGITLVFNVPLNNKLESLEPSGAAAAQFWRSSYLTGWIWWNHLRTVAALLAAALLTLAVAQH